MLQSKVSQKNQGTKISGHTSTLNERGESYYARCYLRALRSLGTYMSHCDYPCGKAHLSIFLSELHSDFDHLMSRQTHRRRLEPPYLGMLPRYCRSDPPTANRRPCDCGTL